MLWFNRVASGWFALVSLGLCGGMSHRGGTGKERRGEGNHARGRRRLYCLVCGRLCMERGLEQAGFRAGRMERVRVRDGDQGRTRRWQATAQDLCVLSCMSMSTPPLSVPVRLVSSIWAVVLLAGAQGPPPSPPLLPRAALGLLFIASPVRPGGRSVWLGTAAPEVTTVARLRQDDAQRWMGAVFLLLDQGREDRCRHWQNQQPQ